MPNEYKGMPIIDDSTEDMSILAPPEYGRGLDLTNRPIGYAYGGTADPFPDSLIIPKSEVQARVQERKDTKRTLRDLSDRVNLPPKNQEQTNYCWVNAPTYCMEVTRVVMNVPMVMLSPASAGAQITNYQNVGGWGKTALQWISDHGLVPVEHWPANAISEKYATLENKLLAMNYRCTEWWELQPQNMEQVWSCLLRDMPVAAGLSWWSHEISYIDVDWVDGDVAIIFRNSWGANWGDNGYGVLQGQKRIPDDAVAPRQAVVS